MWYNGIIEIMGGEKSPPSSVGGIMKRYCTKCHKIHDGKCTADIPRIYIKPEVRNSQADKFRNTKVWRRKAKEILERDYHCCRVCFLAGIINSKDLSVHHIIPIVKDFDRRFDGDNLITLCRYHHEQAEKGKIPAAKLRMLAAEDFAPIPPDR